MFQQKDKVDSVRELFSLPLGRGEAGFMYLGYSGVVLRMMGGTIAFDVADLLKGEEIGALESLDLLIFTHSHGDHYKSGETLEILRATGAQILAEPLVAGDLRGKVPSDKLTTAEPGKTYDIGDFKITAIRGIHRGPINLYHVKMGESSVFHGGDSGYVSVEEYPADLAFLPTGRPSPTASPEDALRMAMDLKPKV
ncbi:MAG: MBL fold metallo-hydrolase, partial [Candidatus Bathyarchaeia archaeon]